MAVLSQMRPPPPVRFGARTERIPWYKATDRGFRFSMEFWQPSQLTGRRRSGPLASAVSALCLLSLHCTSLAPVAPDPASALQPGARTLLDAHNCYPYHGQWTDRIDRALALGVPLAIEQDLRWYVDPASGQGRSLVAHDPPLSGGEPTLREYFFERIRPLMEAELTSGDSSRWPLITLNLDFKTEEDEHLTYLWRVLGEYEDWLTTAPKTAELSPLEPGPLLVLTGDSERQKKVFHDDVPTGSELRLFGAAHVTGPVRDGASDEMYFQRAATTPPAKLVYQPATNYRRWWNNPWLFVEEGGQRNAGEWTEADRARLQALVDHAHNQGLWIRFYTLNGNDPEDDANGWFEGYSFGSLEAARLRWQAAIASGVDFVATDQYEDFHRSFASKTKR